MALVLSIITIFFCAFALGDYYKSGEITDPEIFLGYTFHPMSILAVGLLCYGVLRAAVSHRRAYFVAVGLCALPLSLLAGYHKVQQVKQEIRDAETAAWWSRLDATTNLFAEFYALYPDRVHAISDSEEVTCDGFVSFCQAKTDSKSTLLDQKNGQFLDYAGQPARYFVDLNRDYFIQQIPVSAGSVMVTDNRRACIIDHIWTPNVSGRSKQTDPNVTKLPYGKPIEGKPGFVTSPYPPYAEQNVRSIPRDTVVLDLAARKAFLAP